MYSDSKRLCVRARPNEAGDGWLLRGDETLNRLDSIDCWGVFKQYMDAQGVEMH